MRILLVILLAMVCESISAQPSGTNDSTVRFRTVDISLDSKDKPLAAYQLECSATAGDVRIVGIEGGEHAAFARPPFYDPKAMQQDRVIIAAFSTEATDKLPIGKTRIATIHVHTTASVEPKFQLKVHIAADAGGKPIAVDSIVNERKAK